MMTKLMQRRAAKRAADQMNAFYAWRPSGPGR
jgi:hypothetical protein